MFIWEHFPPHRFAVVTGVYFSKTVQFHRLLFISMLNSQLCFTLKLLKISGLDRLGELEVRSQSL